MKMSNLLTGSNSSWIQLKNGHMWLMFISWGKLPTFFFMGFYKWIEFWRLSHQV